MPHDPALLDDVRAWLAKAAVDLRAGEHDLTAMPPLLEDVLFHCQQATEKALKAHLAWHDHPFRKTHNIEEIGRQSALIDSSLGDLIDRAAPLTEYSWKFRYPGDFDAPTRQEAEQALALAREVVAAIIDLLPPEVLS